MPCYTLKLSSLNYQLFIKLIIRTFLPVLSAIILSSCSSFINNTPTINGSSHQVKSTLDRTAQMQSLSAWEITGKIAFLNVQKRQSANFFWQHLNNNEQHINLTTYLGINLMELTSKNGLHTINVRGKSYESDDLNTLVYQLTGLQLPTQALNYWLKGLPYLPNDNISFNETTLLPQELTSFFNSQYWQINYQAYKLFNEYELATKITIKQANLTIKIVINHWNL